MHNNELAVAGHLYVDLYDVYPHAEAIADSPQGVFGCMAPVTPVSDYQYMSRCRMKHLI
jgi:hypothetical protein